MNPLQKLHELGQSIWLDYISRQLITSGRLQHYIDEDSVTGITSNPAIFDKAISGTTDYDGQIIDLLKQDKSAPDIMEALIITDIQSAVDKLHPIYDRTAGADGFVSIEVSPHLAYDTRATIDDARRLWSIVDRPNVFIKVPATTAGIPAIAKLIGEGININITLLFGLSRYKEVIEAYLQGIETLVKAGKAVNNVNSVASFFLSRIDTMVDPMLDAFTKYDNHNAKLASEFLGQTAISSAKVAFHIFKEAFTTPRFRRLAECGARTQRLLWASTSTKNPAYSDTKYVEPLIGPDTVNTMPAETVDAYRDHGDPAVRIEQDIQKAYQVLDSLQNFSIELDQISDRLEAEGVDKFIKPWDHMLHNLEQKIESLHAARSW
jgi:transaldolase